MNRTTPASTLSSRVIPSAKRSLARAARSESVPITLPPPLKKRGEPQAPKIDPRVVPRRIAPTTAGAAAHLPLTIRLLNNAYHKLTLIPRLCPEANEVQLVASAAALLDEFHAISVRIFPAGPAEGRLPASRRGVSSATPDDQAALSGGR